MSQKYFSNRITIHEIKDNLGIIGNPNLSRLEKSGIQRLGNSAIVKVNRREMEGFIDKYESSRKGFGTFNKNSPAPSTKTLHYRDPADPIDSTLPDNQYSCFDGIDKPSKGQIVVVENPYFKDEVTGDIRITDGGLTHAGVTFPPVGTFGYFGYDNIGESPDGWLECAGQAVVYKRKKNNIYYDTEYTKLYNIIDSWGTFTEFSDIRPTATEGKVFIMPDLRGYFVRGLNITDIGLDNNSSKDKRPFLLHKNADAIDHIHTGESPYNRPEKYEAKNPDRTNTQEIVWFRRPNKSSHRNAPYGEWMTSITEAQNWANHSGSKDHYERLPWLPEESNGYQHVYHGNGGGKFSDYGETSSQSEGWGAYIYPTEHHAWIDFSESKGAPPGLSFYSKSSQDGTTSAYNSTWFVVGNGTGTNYHYVYKHNWYDYSNFWSAWDEVQTKMWPLNRCSSTASELGLSNGHQVFSWDASGYKMKTENEENYYDEGEYTHDWNGNYYTQWMIHDYDTNHHNYGGHNPYINHQTSYMWRNINVNSHDYFDQRNSFYRNPWFRSFDRHMHHNIFTYYRSMTTPDPRPNTEGEWYHWDHYNSAKDIHSNHENCSQNIVRRNEIHWTRLRAKGGSIYGTRASQGHHGCDFYSGYGGIPEYSSSQNSSKSHWNSYYESGYMGIPRRRYFASHHDVTGHGGTGRWDGHVWSAFCFITKPEEGEAGLLNSGDDGVYTSVDGDHSHEIFGGEDGVFYQGQEETRPHNIALRFFVKY